MNIECKAMKRTIKYEGRPCIHGHGTVRYVKGRGCVVCMQDNAQRYQNGVRVPPRPKKVFESEDARREAYNAYHREYYKRNKR